MKNIEDMDEFELNEAKEKIDRLLFDKKRFRKINNLKREIDWMEKQKFEDIGRDKFEDEFDYTHR